MLLFRLHNVLSCHTHIFSHVANPHFLNIVSNTIVRTHNIYVFQKENETKIRSYTLLLIGFFYLQKCIFIFTRTHNMDASTHVECNNHRIYVSYLVHYEIPTTSFKFKCK